MNLLSFIAMVTAIVAISISPALFPCCHHSLKPMKGVGSELLRFRGSESHADWVT